MNEPTKSGATGWRRIANAVRYSAAGLTQALRSEAAFRQEAIIAAILVPLAFFLPVHGAERACLVASVLLVLIVELINSSVEAAVDLASPQHHPLAKRAKDLASAAVMLTLMLTAAVWCLILWPRVRG
jgi:diacylglycerol kinase (ATP)